jgi:CheY-like chemotaxis protein
MSGPDRDVRTVLIVEDEFAIADLLEMVLTDEGYRVLLAANGRQGLACLSREPHPDVVISDYMMPVLDGAGMIQAMRENEAQRDIPCIVMSSIPEASVRQRIPGYAAFVRKPFQIVGMVQLVAAILAASERKA